MWHVQAQSDKRTKKQDNYVKVAYRITYPKPFSTEVKQRMKFWNEWEPRGFYWKLHGSFSMNALNAGLVAT